MKHHFHQRTSWVLSIFLLFIAFTTQTVCAATTACPSQYLNGVAPDILKASLAKSARELCCVWDLGDVHD